MRKTVLIVEDNQINRRLLFGILSREYHVLEAENGARALAMLERWAGDVSAVLLDLSMPVMDGFGLLEHMRGSADLCSIPVIVTTDSKEEAAEVRALSLGAGDFVTKPYNPALILHCLRNAIRLREAVSMASAATRDKLTGLYSREAFFEKAADMLKKRSPGFYVMSSFDIDNFKLINDQYGASEGDRILRHIGGIVEADMSAVGGICSRISADNFAALYPATIQQADSTAKTVTARLIPADLRTTLSFRVGRYLVTDLSLPANTIYDRAYLAKQSVKGRYDEHIAYFDESMREKLLRQQEIVDEMDAALAQHQFEVWFQPQFNHASGALIGAEALVRWRHPKRGLIPPGDFIPVFEQNGFIYALDKYVWESVCICLRRWLDEGLSPLPVSVNVSRYDVFRPDLIETITGLAEKYGIPTHLLRLEITESAFAKSSGQIIAVVKQLMGLGFTLEIDDFGSGYSSLNTLKDVPANVLKLDMKFLESNENSGRGGNILESVVRMAKWLDMSVIAEGVETIEQADFLKSIGCSCIQGYLYAKPMPTAEYEALARRADREERRLPLKTVETLDNNAFWDPNSMDTLIFNSYLGGACIFEYHGGHIELLRANDKYMQVLGSPDMTVEAALRLSWAQHMDDKTAAALEAALRRSIETGDETSEELAFSNLPGCPARTHLRSTMRVIASSGDRYLVYCTNENITAQRQAEQKEREASVQLEAIMNNIGGGVTATVIENGAPRLLFANSQFYRLLGYSKDRCDKQAHSLLDYIHPDDRARVVAQMAAASIRKSPFTVTCRIVRPDKSVRCLQSNISIATFPDVAQPVLLAVANDITKQRQAQAREHRAFEQIKAIMADAGSGITASIVTKGKIRFLLANDKYYDILGFSRRQYKKEVRDPYDLVHPEDRARVSEAFACTPPVGKTSQLEYRIFRRDGAQRWVKVTLSSTRFEGIDQLVSLRIYADITAQRQAELLLRETDELLQFLSDAAHDVLSQPDGEEGIDLVLRRLLHYFDGGRAYVFELDAQKETLRNTYEVCAPGVPRVRDCLQSVSPELCRFWLHAFERQSHIDIPDAAALDAKRPDKALLQELGITSLIAVPLLRDGVIVGFLGVDNPRAQRSGAPRLAALGDYIIAMLIRRDLTAKILSDNNMLQSLMNDTPGGFLRILVREDNSLVPLYSNDGFSRLVGMSHEQLAALCGEDMLAIVHPDDAPAVSHTLTHLLTKGEARSARHRLHRAQGGYLQAVFFGRMITASSGERFLNVYYTDASQLDRQEELRRELLDNMPCGAALYEFEGGHLTVIHLNKRYRELVDRPLADLSALSVLHAVHPDDRGPLMAELALAIEEQRDAQNDIRILCGEQGLYRTFHTVGRIIPREEGKFAIYVSYTQMQSQGISYQQMLPVVLSAVMRSSSELSFVKDQSLRYICCSHAFAQLVGLSDEQEVIGKTDDDFADRQMALRCGVIDRRILESGQAQLSYDEILPADGGPVHYASMSKYPLMDGEGKVIGIYGVGRDVTPYRTAFERLRLLTNNIPGGIASFELGKGGLRLTYFNQGFYAFSGYSRQEFAQKSALDPFFLVFREDLPELRATMAALQEGRTRTVDCTYRLHTKGGGCRWFSLKGAVSGGPGETLCVNVVQFDTTEQREAGERLRMSEEQFRIAAALGDRTVARYDIKTETCYIDSELPFAPGLGREIKNAPQTFVNAGVIHQASVGDFLELFQKVHDGAKHVTATVLTRLPAGAPRWLRLDATTVFDAAGLPSQAILVFFDVTEQREKEAVFKKWQQSLQERAPDSYTLFRCNLSKDASFDSIEGSLLQADFGSDVTTFNARTKAYAENFVHASDREEYIAVMNSDALLASYYRGKRAYTLQYREITPAGSLRWLRLLVELVEYPDSSDVEAYLMYENIDDRKRAELLTLRRAQTDPLTGVLNRGAFLAAFEHLTHPLPPGVQHALLILDVDGFKLVNDAFGHAAGDRALIDIANSLKSVLRRGDLLGRLGGDEFLVLLTDLPNDAAAAKKAAQICTLLRKPFGSEIEISASVGVAMCPRDGHDFDTLYRKVDAALYHIKGLGKNNFAFYQKGMCDQHLALEEETARNGAPARQAKRRMLIVAQKGAGQTLLTGIFQEEFLLEIKDGAEAALTYLRQCDAALSVVVLDLLSPDAGGLETLRRIRAEEGLRSIPVVVVGGETDRESCLRAIREGAADFAIRPVDPDLLRIRVRAAINRAQNKRLPAGNGSLKARGEKADPKEKR